MMNLLRDIRHAIRLLMRAPAHTAVVALTLALGIGASTAIYSVVQSVLLRPLPYDDAESLAMIWSSWRNESKSWVGPAEYADYLDELATVRSLGIWAPQAANLTGVAGDPERLAGAAVNAALFETLGVRPARGRSFTAEEDAPGPTSVIVITDELWRRRFGGAEDILGREIRLDGSTVAIVGVMPPGFRLPTDHASATPAEFFFPLGLDPAQVNRSYRGNHFLFCAARLRGGVPPGQLNRELVNLFDRWTHDEGLYPVDAQMTAFATSVREEIVGETRPALLTLLAASGLLLLIACVNIANLLLARGDGRQRELAIRAALGGSRRRLVRQLLTESLLLALVGGAAGLLVASFVLDGMAAMDLVRLPRAHTLGLDRTAVAFALGVSVITGTLFGLGPALRAAGTNLLAGLRDGAAGAGIGRGRRGVQGALVVAQLAMAVVLLSGAGLLLRSFLAMSSVDPGFEAAARLTFRLNVPQSSYPQTADVVGLFDRIVTELRAVPEIVNIGAVSRLPMDGEIGDWDFQIDGRPLEPGRHPVGDWKVVTGGYFQTMGMRLVSGRLISNADTADALQVAVINETLARQYWPGESPVGTRIRMLGPSQGDWVTIVGVVGDVRHEGPRGEVRGTYFRPHAQIANSTGFTMRAMSVVAHVRGEPAAAVGAVRTRMALIDPDLPLAQVQSLSAIVSGSVSGPRLTTVLTGTFALVALALAAVGLYGVISYLVSRRVRELGVRIALGARPLNVLGLVLGRGAVLVLIGLILGLGVSLACARLLATQLFGVSALDPATMVAVAVVLAVVALLAFLGPAWRAVRIDPMVALRSE